METVTSYDKALERAYSLIASLKQAHPELEDDTFLVGCWVWVETEEKPSPEVISYLKELGFKWNSVRKAWQHSCGYLRRRADYDPRKKYTPIAISNLRLKTVVEVAPEQ